MPRYYFRKLVRDKIVDNCLTDPKVTATDYRVLTGREYRQALIDKVSEEAAEIPLDDSDQNAVLAELADLQCVIDAIREDAGLSIEQVRAAADYKTAKKGGFDSGYYIESVDLTDDSEWNDILRKQPDKYEEELRE